MVWENKIYAQMTRLETNKKGKNELKDDVSYFFQNFEVKGNSRHYNTSWLFS